MLFAGVAIFKNWAPYIPPGEMEPLANTYSNRWQEMMNLGTKF